jgi:RNA polymerase sigma-70 factor, ECF subfamily
VPVGSSGERVVHLEETSVCSPPPATRVRSPELRLVEQVLAGDVEAGRRLVLEYYRSIYRYLHRLTGRAELAEDLTQDTFVEAWRSLPTYEGRASLRLWLYRIAHRQFLQALRSRRPVASLEEASEAPEPRAPAQAGAVELRAVVGKLPLEMREVVVLHYFEGYNCEEIAEILGAPAGTIKYRLFEARARLRRELVDEEPGTEGGG